MADYLFVNSGSVRNRLVQSIALLSAGLAIPHAFALNPSKTLTQYELSSWSNKSGLSQIAVMSIAQTRDGFIWLATEEGLVRFDGIGFLTFDERNTPKLPDRFIRSLATGPDGSLWIGTRSGIARLYQATFSSVQRETDFSEDVYDLCVGRDGSVWFSSANGLHLYRNGKSRVFTTADGLPDNGITAITEAPDGAIWIGTRSGLVRELDGKFKVYGNPRSTSVNTLTAGRNGDIWFGTLDGAIEHWRNGVITTRWTAGHHPDVRAQCIREDSDGNLWVALSHAGLVRIQSNRVDFLTQQNGLASNNPDWMFEDREHILWIGLADAGLSSLHDGRFLNVGTPEGLSSNHVSSVLQARSGSIWVGTDDAGVNRIDGARVKTYSAGEGLHEKSVLALLERHDGSIWVGSQDGIVSRIQGERASVAYRPSINPPPRLPAMMEASEQNLWLGFEIPDGLTLYRNGVVRNVALKGRVRGMATDSAGSLWIASYGEGLVQLSKNGQRVFSTKDGLPSSLVTTVFVDSSDTVWAGTALSGLIRVKGDQVRVITPEQGLFDNTVGAMVEDDCGYLWMTSSRGLSRTLKSDLNAAANGSIPSFRSESFGYADGLRSQEFSIGAQPAVWKARDGRLWFATMGGVVSIDPRDISRNAILPEVHFESIFLNGKPIPPLAGTQLGPFSGRLQISFTAPSFTNPERVRLQYRLGGFESRWIDAGTSRRVEYTNLPPGKYQLEVRAASSDQKWGATATLPFECRAYFHQTLWFRALSTVILGIFSWLFYRWRVRYLRAKNAELEAAIALRTADLQKAVDAARSAQDLLWEQAMRDALTGLLNRRAILDLLEKETQQCLETGQELSIVLADLDHFKSINDTYGHLAGDRVLQEVSKVLTSGVRDAEKVGRYGGEEILIVLVGCSLSHAVSRADELRVAVSSHPIQTEGTTLFATFSVGVADFHPAKSSRQLIAEADAALYRAKEAGRDCVRSCSPSDEWMFHQDLVR